jgi:hypothetical protein
MASLLSRVIPDKPATLRRDLRARDAAPEIVLRRAIVGASLFIMRQDRGRLPTAKSPIPETA